MMLFHDRTPRVRDSPSFLAQVTVEGSEADDYMVSSLNFFVVRAIHLYQDIDKPQGIFTWTVCILINMFHE